MRSSMLTTLTCVGMLIFSADPSGAALPKAVESANIVIAYEVKDGKAAPPRIVANRAGLVPGKVASLAAHYWIFHHGRKNDDVFYVMMSWSKAEGVNGRWAMRVDVDSGTVEVSGKRYPVADFEEELQRAKSRHSKPH